MKLTRIQSLKAPRPFRPGRWLHCLAAFAATSAAFAGPGGSAGNPTMLVSSLVKNYLFTSPAPTLQSFTPKQDSFEFKLSGFKMDVETLGFDARRCAPKNTVKTVCTDGPNQWIVVFGDHATFRLKMADLGGGAANLATIGSQIVASFSRGESPSTDLRKD